MKIIFTVLGGLNLMAALIMTFYTISSTFNKLDSIKKDIKLSSDAKNIFS